MTIFNATLWREKSMLVRPRRHGNVFLRFCIVSSNELVVLDSLEKSKQYTKTQENVSVCTGPYMAINLLQHRCENLKCVQRLRQQMSR